MPLKNEGGKDVTGFSCSLEIIGGAVLARQSSATRTPRTSLRGVFAGLACAMKEDEQVFFETRVPQITTSRKENGPRGLKCIFRRLRRPASIGHTAPLKREADFVKLAVECPHH